MTLLTPLIVNQDGKSLKLNSLLNMNAKQVSGTYQSEGMYVREARNMRLTTMQSWVSKNPTANISES